LRSDSLVLSQLPLFGTVFRYILRAAMSSSKRCEDLRFDSLVLNQLRWFSARSFNTYCVRPRLPPKDVKVYDTRFDSSVSLLDQLRLLRINTHSFVTYCAWLCPRDAKVSASVI